MRQALLSVALCTAVLPSFSLAEIIIPPRPEARPNMAPAISAALADTAELPPSPAEDAEGTETATERGTEAGPDNIVPASAIAQDASPQTPTDVLMPALGRELDALGEEIAIEELNHLARFALEQERPDIFRSVMISHYDPHWEGLSDARTALNMIGWLPDTADFLPPRIDAARLAISAGELPQIEAQRLWRDLRARVERVGNPLLLQDLAKAMIASGDTELLLETISRFHTSDRERLQTLSAILCLEVLSPGDAVAEQIYDEMERLIGSGLPAAALPPEAALAYWKIGRFERALELVDLNPDPLQRVRSHFELLALTPPVASPAKSPETLSPGG